MAIALVVFFAVVCGAISNQVVQYWISRGIAFVRPNSPLLGEWKIEYLRDDEMIEEKLVMYGEFADISYGDLHARLASGETEMYRARLEHFFDHAYSVVIRPANMPHADVGLGVLRFDSDTNIVTGRLVGLSSERNKLGQNAYVREIKASSLTSSA